MAGLVGQSGPCIGLLELASIAAGLQTTDAVLKQASVQVLNARPVSPGKFVLLFTGEVEDVSASLRRGVEVAGGALVDRLFIPDVEPTLLEHVRGTGSAPETLGAVGAIETLSVASTIVAGDVAAKTASIQLVSLGLARGLGGKSWVCFTGEVGDVSAAVEAGSAGAAEAGLLVHRVVIPRPHDELGAVLAFGVPLS